MALTRTTLSSAVGVDDTSIVVASATGFATGRLLRIDQEFLQVAQSYNGTATTIPVLRGREGSLTSAHVVTAGVVVGTQADDWDEPGTGVPVGNITAGRPRVIESITADLSTAVPPPARSGHRLIPN